MFFLMELMVVCIMIVLLSNNLMLGIRILIHYILILFV